MGEPISSDELPVCNQDVHLLVGKQGEGIVKQGVAEVLVAVSPVGKQLKEQWNGDVLPNDGEHQDIHVLASKLPICAVQEEGPRPCLWKQGQEQPSQIRRVQWMTVKKAFDTPNHRLDLRPTGKPLGEFSVPNIFGLQHGTKHQQQEVKLIFAVFRERMDEVDTQGRQDV